ncbi:MAG: hypothetical protein OEZ07_05550 [Dehalococcoidia bacterium]|nr:hypothetical protein [Dehalococcoidia bacterium]
MNCIENSPLWLRPPHELSDGSQVVKYGAGQHNGSDIPYMGISPHSHNHSRRDDTPIISIRQGTRFYPMGTGFDILRVRGYYYNQERLTWRYSGEAISHTGS